MTLDGLANAAVSAIELHCALDLERRRTGGVSGYANKHEPLFIRGGAVVDDLRAEEGRVSIKDFLWRCSSVEHRPMVNGGLCNNPNSILRYPFPEDDIFVVHV